MEPSREPRPGQNQLEIRPPSRPPQVPLQKEIFYAVKDLALSRAEEEFSSEQSKRVDVAQRIFRQLPKKTREILYRYYVSGQTAEQIAAEFAIASDEFQKIKNQTKARLLDAWNAPNSPVGERDYSAA